uniref:F-box domain-containing protein n=1 Tax=Caenorhabditis tropicalis TaxID=1561998 RepID=A0A1I7UDQ3_9PELO
MTLSHPSLKCVLEYLEANQRIRLSARCPSIRQLEKQIPIHLNYLSISESSVTINEISYSICKPEGSITVENGRPVLDKNVEVEEIGFSKSDASWTTRRLPEKLKFDVAMDKLASVLLEPPAFCHSDIKETVRNWIKNEQEIGTVWKFRCVNLEIIPEIKREFNGKAIRMADKKFFRHWGCVSIPINSTSTFIIYAVRERSLYFVKMLVVEN